MSHVLIVDDDETLRETGAIEVRAVAGADKPGPALAPERTPPLSPFDGGAEPAFPQPTVPSGHVWPATTGRALLRRLPDRIRLCRELLHKQGKHDGSGKIDTLVYRSGDYCLKTSLRRRYPEGQEGTQALMRLIRAKSPLGELLPPSTVLVLQPEATTGATWLWTVTPWMPSLRSSMASAEERGDGESLSRALVRYARASFLSLRLVRAKQLVLDINPSNFAMYEGSICYVDDYVLNGAHAPSLGYAWLKRVDEYAAAPDVVEHYVSELEVGINRNLSSGDAAALSLVTVVEQTMVLTDLGRDAKQRLLSAVRRCR